jgi:hypothetical protein
MFEKFASTPARKSSTQKVELTVTTAFVQALVSEGLRLSYGALAQASRTLGEDASTQILAQRGAGLVKSLPVILQPHVCRKAGGYKKGVLESFKVELPGDLCDRPVIDAKSVGEALEIFLNSQEG